MDMCFLCDVIVLLAFISGWRNAGFYLSLCFLSPSDRRSRERKNVIVPQSPIRCMSRMVRSGDGSSLVWVVVILCGVGLAIAFANPSPLLNQLRINPPKIMHLHSGTEKSGVFLQINDNGQVDGTHQQTVYSALLIKTIEAGFVVITGKESRWYLCMDRKGNLFGSQYFRLEDCIFIEKNLGNGRAVYLSRKDHILMSLQQANVPVLPGGNSPSYTQFFSFENKIPLTQFNRLGRRRHTRNADVNPSDPNQILRSLRGRPHLPITQAPYFNSPKDPIRINQNDLVDSDDPNAVMATWRQVADRFSPPFQEEYI